MEVSHFNLDPNQEGSKAFLGWLYSLSRGPALCFSWLVGGGSLGGGLYLGKWALDVGHFPLLCLGILGFGVGGLLLGYGVSVFLQPNLDKLGVKGKHQSPGFPLEANRLDAQILGLDYPYYVCIKCWILFEKEECHGTCAKCLRRVDCQLIENEQDRKILFTLAK